MSTDSTPKETTQSFIPLCVPEIRGNEWKYIKECLDTNWVSSVGSYVNRFEEMVANRVEAKYGVAVVNGTAALHMALLVAGVQPDDEVLVSTLTFIAPANAIRYVGAWPIFIDAEPTYWQMDAQKVVNFLETQCIWKNGTLSNQQTGRRIKAIMPVHILGHPVDMDPILAVAEKYQLVVIEDATESLGATYKDRPVGNLGHIGCFSFNGNKILTTGGGGMIVTDNEVWARKATFWTTQAKADPIEYLHDEVGYNYRLTNIQAAMGCAQMEQLDDYIANKRRLAAHYAKALAETIGLTLMQEADWAFSIYWMYTILINETLYGQDRRQVLERLQAAKIQTRPLWQPLHLSPAHRSQADTNPLTVAEILYKQGLSLPCSVGLTPSDQIRVLDILRDNTR